MDCGLEGVGDGPPGVRPNPGSRSGRLPIPDSRSPIPDPRLPALQDRRPALHAPRRDGEGRGRDARAGRRDRVPGSRIRGVLREDPPADARHPRSLRPGGAVRPRADRAAHAQLDRRPGRGAHPRPPLPVRGMDSPGAAPRPGWLPARGRPLQPSRPGSGRPWDPLRLPQPFVRVRAARGGGPTPLRRPAGGDRTGARVAGAGPVLDHAGGPGSTGLLRPLPGAVPPGARQGFGGSARPSDGGRRRGHDRLEAHLRPPGQGRDPPLLRGARRAGGSVWLDPRQLQLSAAAALLMERREAVTVLGAAALGITGGATRTIPAPPRPPPPGGRLRQAVCRWPFQAIPFPEFCRAARAMGLAAIDLLTRDDWERVRDAGLVCSMGYPYATERRGFIQDGFNAPANHAMLLRELEEAIPLAARAGVPNVIAMFGNRRGRPDAEAIEHCVTGLGKIKQLAEEQGVTVCLELLNSKVDHADYQGDHTAFGVAVVRAVGSPRVKLLYDIYHMQIMEGDVIRTIRDHQAWIAHFHTGGVPGRHELDDTQELNWRAIATAIADTGFSGYVAHEFQPTRDPLASLRQAVAACAV